MKSWCGLRRTWAGWLLCSAAALALTSSGGSSHAATVWKNSSASSLNQTTTWWTTEAGPTNPSSIGTTDTLRFGGTSQAASGTWALGGNLSVGAIRLDNGSATTNYNAGISAGSTLTLNGNNDYSGSYLSGLVLNSAAGGTLTIASDVVVASTQKWVASRALSVTGNVDLGANTLSFFSAGSTTTLSGTISGSGGIARSDSSGGAVVISGTANSYTGVTTTGIGTLQVYGLANGGVSSSIGASGSAATNVVLSANTSLALAGNVAASTTDRLFTMAGSGTISNTNATAANSLSFTNTGSVAHSGAGARTLSLAGANTGSNSFALAVGDNGASATSLRKAEAGTWTVSNAANTYTGATTLVGGVLHVSKIANGGVSSSIGASTNAAGSLVFNGGALSYVGSGDSTNRAFTITAAPSISANGSGALTWSGATPTFTTANTAYAITLGGTSVADNTWGTVLADNGSGAIALTKSGSGKWILSGSNSYSGVTTVNAGTLALAGNNSLGAGLSGSAGVVLDFGANTVTLGNSGTDATYTFSGKLSGSGVIRFRGGPTTIAGSSGAAGGNTNYEALSPTTANMPPTAFSLDTGASASDRRDLVYLNDTGDALVLSSLSGYGAIRGDGGGAATRVITVNQAADTTFNGALLSHYSTGNAVRGLSLEKTGTGALELAGFIGKQTASAGSGTAPVNLTANGGLLSVTNAANTTTSNANAIWTGTVTVTSGTLAFSTQALVNTAGSAGVSSILMNGGVLRWNAGTTQDITVGGRLSLVASKTATFDTNGNNVSLGTAFGGATSAGLAKIGSGSLTLSAVNSYTGPTNVNGGSLIVNGTLAGTSGVTVASGASINGSGRVAAALAGAGWITPGNSAGIMTAAGINPAAGMGFSFEFTGTGSPTYSNSSASVNDVLRLTDATAFTSSLTSVNVVDVYLGLASILPGNVFRGGFYVDGTTGFSASVDNATFNYWVLGNGGGADKTLNGQGYYSLANYDAGYSITRTTVADTANFASGTVAGGVTEFIVVPEPAASAAGCLALVATARMLRRRPARKS